jgi:hypothetical protein
MRTEKEIQDRIERLNIILSEDLGVFVPSTKKMAIRHELNILKWIIEEHDNPSSAIHGIIGSRLGEGKEKEVIEFLENNKDKNFSAKDIMGSVEVKYPYLQSILAELTNSRKLKSWYAIGRAGNPRVYQWNNGTNI